MTFTIGEVRCANCLRSQDDHCQTCWSCDGEPTQECCMEGWSEEAKAFERRHWASLAPAPEQAPAPHREESDV